VNVSFYKTKGGIPGQEPRYGNCTRCHEYKLKDSHHRLKRSQGGTDEYVIKLCRKCHDWVENHPIEAEREGFHISAGIPNVKEKDD